MSAVFIVKCLLAPIRFVERTSARAVFEVAASEQRATPFVSEADAWLAIHQYGLKPDQCQVVPLK